MKLQRILTILLVCIMCLNPMAALAEYSGNGVPDSLYYKGGVIERGYLSGFQPKNAADTLELGYALGNSPYIVLNKPTVWEATISGGDAEYTCEVWLACQTDLSLDPYADMWSVQHWFTLSGDSFSYTFTTAGRYFWQFNVTDGSGQTLVFQTRIYETYTEADESDPSTVPGKVNSIVDELITPAMSDYSRALALHDWLIYNANYDYTFTHYDAAGVLLYGTGVCDSYARAYLMLMTAAGVDCMIVTGEANGNHAWNLVKLNGSWYHVDCTWDDPNKGGGFERHTYFCLDDETMALDHTWNRPGSITDTYGMLVPAAEGGEYSSTPGSAMDYDFTFSSIEEFDAAFDAEMAAGNRNGVIRGLYTGTEYVNTTVWYAFLDWVYNTMAPELYAKDLINSYGMEQSGNLFSVTLDWKFPGEYIRINEETLRMSIGETVTIEPSEYYPAADAFTWTSSDPSVATVSSAYDRVNGLTATITALSGGSTTITATSADGLSDSIEVTVLPAYKPEFNLTQTETDSGLRLDWDMIPGATEYRVVYTENGTETVLATVTNDEYTVAMQDIPANTLNELFIRAVRVVGGNDSVSFTSEKYTYVTLAFDSALPENIVSVESEAFAGVAGIDSLYIPDGAAAIGAAAFADTGIDVIRIPASVTSISPDAFEGSDVDFVQTEKGSPADEWFREHMPGVYIKYE